MDKEKFKKTFIGNIISKLRVLHRLDALEQRLDLLPDILHNDASVISWDTVGNWTSESDNLELLKLRLSITPSVWGDKSRLHISELACVHSSFFNTNSGEIYIGDYSFSGSNVSFLTGSHDKCLTGLLRRDCEIKEGNDIRIGNGVWIASNSTILGPCEIGDDAVVAAGAVVAPGTIIPCGCVYGGIPAKKLSTIDLIKDRPFERAEFKKALEREGVLFGYGWSEKETHKYNDRDYEIHCMIDAEATVYSAIGNVQLYYFILGDFKEMFIDFDDKKIKISENEGYINVNINGMAIIKNPTNMKIYIGYNYKSASNHEEKLNVDE